MRKLAKEAVIETLRSYLSGLPEVCFVYLFRSSAKGTENRLSEVDVAVGWRRYRVFDDVCILPRAHGKPRTVRDTQDWLPNSTK